MIALAKLLGMRGRARLRKCSLVLEGIQRIAMAGEGIPPFAIGLAEGLAADESLAPDLRMAAGALAIAGSSPGTSAPGTSALRALDALRHACIRASGQSPADWDLLAPSQASSAASSGQRTDRALDGRLRVYLEDIRSPFNVGTIFRTAEAFGFSEILLSPDCADPLHPRALRSSMGTISMIPWRRASLGEAVDSGPLFALELGGTDIGGFGFPECGTVVLGSEELGVSAEALALCSLGKVSIPMRGAKASMNVAVAFGVLAYAWTSRI